MTQDRSSDLAKICQPCLIDDTKEMASCFCVDCVEYLCLNCKREHRKNKFTRGHKILEEKDMPSDHSLFSKMKELMLCSEHGTSEVEYKCEDHDQFICVICLAFTHRKCENVAELAKCQVYESLHEKLEKLQKEADKNKIFSKQNMENVRMNERKIIKESSEFTQMVVQKLLQLDEKLKLGTKALVESKCKEIEINVEKCEKLEQEANSCLQVSANVKMYGNTEQLVVLSNQLRKRVELLGKENTSYSDRNVESLTFEKNNLLEGIKNIGKISFVKMADIDSKIHNKLIPSSHELSVRGDTGTKSSLDGPQANSSVEPGEKIKSKSLLYRKITSVSFAFSLRSPSDERCCFITGFAMLNKKLVVIDRHNVKIKVFNNDYTLSCERKLSRIPLDVCSIVNCIALVTDNSKKIKVYEISKESLVKKREFSTKYFPLSITVKNGWESYVLFSDQPCVASKPRQKLELHLRNLKDSHTLHIFNIYKYMSFNSFTDVYRVHYTSKGKIVVSEYQKFSTFVDDVTEIKMLWFYKSNDCRPLYDISDIESDGDGNIYVCGSKSMNIHQISCDSCNDSKFVLCIGRPSALYLDNDKSQLIVALCNEDRVWALQFQK